MPGIIELNRLLRSLDPILSAAEYVFSSFEGAVYRDHRELSPICAYQEKEGLTLIIAKDAADQNGLTYFSTYKRITLRVHSSLNAVGLTASVSRRLSERGISANIVAAYHHDHIFVPSKKADAALAALQELQCEANKNQKDFFSSQQDKHSME